MPDLPLPADLPDWAASRELIAPARLLLVRSLEQQQVLWRLRRCWLAQPLTQPLALGSGAGGEFKKLPQIKHRLVSFGQGQRSLDERGAQRVAVDDFSV